MGNWWFTALRAWAWKAENSQSPKLVKIGCTHIDFLKWVGFYTWGFPQELSSIRNLDSGFMSRICKRPRKAIDIGAMAGNQWWVGDYRPYTCQGGSVWPELGTEEGS